MKPRVGDKLGSTYKDLKLGGLSLRYPRHVMLGSTYKDLKHGRETG